MKNVVDVLEQRGFIDAVTSPEVKKHLSEPRKIYCGFDPTADSLHLGNLIAIMGLAWMQKFGHTAVAIVGGATGMIGDPSGKKKERKLLDEEQIQKNLQGIERDLKKVLKSDNLIVLNNIEWFGKFSFIDFLRDVGKCFRIGPMLAKESVRSRLDSPEGMSFTEFSYQLLQAYDFYHLFETKGVTVQIGGSDQWGNITAGQDLIRKLTSKSVFGITFPLLTTSDGKKFGKTESGALWLSEEKQSPYSFFQYLYRVPDADVIRLMKMLTFMDLEEIYDYEQMMQQENYKPNTAQKRLAEEVTKIVHGEKGLRVALQVTEGLKPGAKAVLDLSVLESLKSEVPFYDVKREDFINKKLVDLLSTLKILPSKGEVRRLIRNRGLYLNNVSVDDELYLLEEKDLIESKMLLLALGKKKKVLICVK